MSSAIKQSREKGFVEILEGLNPKQQRAVTNIEGPMLVIAGPGTGKTHMLASRIGKILQMPDIMPQNILCMTFTNAGVVAMRERLLKFIGPEAHNINIYTFHSFCDNIIRNNLDRFGHQNLEPITDLERIELIENLINELPYENPLVKGSLNPLSAVSQFRDLFGRIKQEGWEVQDLYQKIEAYIKDLPLREDYIYKRKSGNNNKGDVKQNKVDQEVDKVNRLKAGIALFPKYEEMMNKAAKYEFADMINWVIEAFKNDDGFLGLYQEQFQYILVDEYQDTNGSQHELLHLLTSFWDAPNLFVVGDDDQSIFEFQGARLANILDFYQDHQNTIEMVILDENYRSSKKILDGSKVFIEKNQERLINQIAGLTKELIASNSKVANFEQKPQFFKYPNPLQEAIDICDKIEKLIAEGVPPSEIAIIYKKHAISDPYVEIFTKRKIPHDTVRPLNILDSPLIDKLTKFLFYLDTEFRAPNSGDYLLFEIMHYLFLNLERHDLQQLTLYRSQFKKGERPSLRSLIAKDEKELSEIGIKNPESVINFSNLLAGLIQDTANIPFYILVEKVLNHTGWIKYLLTVDNGLEYLQTVQTFKDFIQLEIRKNPKFDINALVIMMDKMRTNRLQLNLKNYAQGGNKVQLMTAHGSKGLEFDYVFMPNCNKSDWTRKNTQGKFSYPDTITLSGSSDAEEVNRRLFYVAITRAKRHLQISFPSVNFNEKKSESAPFVNEFMEALEIEAAVEKVVPEKKVLEYLGTMQTMAEAPKIEALDSTIIDKLLKGFQLSASAFNTFLRCPLSFFYERVIAVPTISSPQASYGTAMHRALQEMYSTVNEDKKLLEIADVLKVFEEEMNKQAGYFEEAFFNNRLDLGRNNLKLYHRAFKATIPPEVKTEMEVYHTHAEGVPIGGEIDRVNFYDNKEVEIIDYKTGRHESSRLRPPSTKEPYGGSYWRQLYFYHILYKAHSPGHRIRSAKIVYTNPDKRTEAFTVKDLEYRAEDELQIRDWMKDAYARIMKHDFYEGCGEENCTWCNFVKDNQLNIEVLDTEEEYMADTMHDDPAVIEEKAMEFDVKENKKDLKANKIIKGDQGSLF